LFIFRFNTITSPFESDEGEYAYSAQLLHDGGTPYKEAFMQKPPMIIYTYYFSQFISDDTYMPRLFAFIFLVLTILTIADLLQKEYGWRSSVIFLIIFPPLVSLPLFSGLDAQPEVFLLLPLATSVWCYFKWIQTKNLWWLAAVGGFSAIACFFKPIIIPAVFFVMVWALFTKKNKQNILSQTVKRFISMFFGFLVLTTMIVFPIAMRGGLSFMWNSVFTYNYYYSFVMGLQFSRFYLVLSTLWPIILTAVWFTYRKIKNWVFWLGFFITSLVGTFSSYLLHYYIIVLPAISIIFAIAIDDLFNYTELQNSNIRKNNYFAFGFSLLVVIFLWFPYINRFSMNSEETVFDQFGFLPFRESHMMAEKLQEITSPNDKVFIYGNEPQILYYAHRKNIDRFVITYPFFLNNPYKNKYIHEMEADLQNTSPKVIITEGGIPPLHTINLEDPESLSPLTKNVIKLLAKNYKFAGCITIDETGQHFVFQSSINNLDGKTVQLAIFLKKN
jgi:hypothetical protein